MLWVFVGYYKWWWSITVLCNARYTKWQIHLQRMYIYTHPISLQRLTLSSFRNKLVVPEFYFDFFNHVIPLDSIQQSLSLSSIWQTYIHQLLIYTQAIWSISSLWCWLHKWLVPDLAGYSAVFRVHYFMAYGTWLDIERQPILYSPFKLLYVNFVHLFPMPTNVVTVERAINLIRARITWDCVAKLCISLKQTTSM